MKGMLSGIAALLVGFGCGGRTVLTLDDAPAATSDTSSSMGHLSSDAVDAATTTLIPLRANSTGVIGENSIGVMGFWYAWGDGWGLEGPPGACETLGGFPMEECSSVTFPPPGSFPQSAPETFCLKGTAAQIIGVPPNFDDIYGIGLSVDLNNNGDVKMWYDAQSAGVIGFQFDIANLPPGGALVELPTPESNMNGFAYWGMRLTNPLPSGGKNVQILFSALQPLAENPPPFDSAHLLSVQFYVPSVQSNPVPVQDLCVSNLEAIVRD